MKLLSLLAATLASAALLALAPLSFEATVSIGFSAGLIGILIADYTHSHRPIAQKYSVYAPRAERLRLAA